MNLTTDLKNLLARKMKMQDQPATITIHFPDSSTFSGNVFVKARGVTRKETCTMPPLMVGFKSSASPLSSLNKLKLVCGCSASSNDEQMVLKEYLVYKIYNLLTDMSFRVRLVNITYKDSRGKRKTFSQYGFFIEDVDVMAKRNSCREVNKIAFNQTETNPEQMSLVDIFQFMVGNTDWSVPNYHNIKLIRKRNAEDAPPYVVPYDFDYCGLVNAYYAVPSELVNIKKVTEREYRGFPRSMQELQQAISIFIKQKENIFKLITDFEPIAEKYKRELTDYLNAFYVIISDNKMVQREFIDNARKN